MRGGGLVARRGRGAGRVPGDLPGDLRVPAGGADDAGVGAGASVAHRAGWTAALRRRALLAVATRDAFERGGRAEDSEDAAGGSEAAARRTAAADSAAALRGALRTLDGLSEDPDGSSEDAAGLRATLLRAAAPATARWAAVADAAIGACASLLEEEAGEAGETRSGALEAFAAAFRDACASAAEGLRVGEGGEGGGEPGAAAAGDAIARLAARGVVPEAHLVVAGLGGDALAVVSAFAAAAAARGEGSGSGSGSRSRPEARDAARRAAAVVAEGAREVAEAAARAAEAATGAAAAEAARRARAWFRDFARTSGEESDGGEGGERAVPSAETYEAVAGKIVASIAETLGETEAIGNALAARCRAVGAGE